MDLTWLLRIYKAVLLETARDYAAVQRRGSYPTYTQPYRRNNHAQELHNFLHSDRFYNICEWLGWDPESTRQNITAPGVSAAFRAVGKSVPHSQRE